MIIKYTITCEGDRIEAFREFLLRQGRKFGKAAWMFYALVFLLIMTGLLAAVYAIFGWLALKSPTAVLVLTGVLVLLIFYVNLRKKS
jgi:hypothetical protein